MTREDHGTVLIMKLGEFQLCSNIEEDLVKKWSAVHASSTLIFSYEQLMFDLVVVAGHQVLH